MSKEDVLKELYDQCEWQQFDQKCGTAEDCSSCFIDHAISYIEGE